MVLSCPAYVPANSLDAAGTRAGLLAIYASSSAPNLAVMKDVTLDPVSGHVNTSDLASQYANLTNTLRTLTPADEGIPAVQVQIGRDADLRTSLEAEYCFYYGRYQWALTKWLEYATNRNAYMSSEASDMLSILKTLNIRVIFIIEFMNYVAQNRAMGAQGETASISALNTEFNREYASLQAVQEKLNKENAIVLTQREMVRYTATKNSATMSTVIFWGVANVIALGAIGAVYTMM